MRPDREDQTLFSERFRYVCGPNIACAANGDWLVTWNMSVELEIGPYSPRRYLHPPDNPEFSNYMIRSRDQGKTWEVPRIIPSYDWRGTEHVALCVLENDEILASFYQREFFTLEEGEKNQSHRYGWYHRPPYPWVVTHGGTYVHRSLDHGETWGETVKIDPSPFISAYGRLRITELDSDTLIFTAGAADPMFARKDARLPYQLKNALGNRLVDGEIVQEPSRVFICISRDGGHTWNESREIAAHPEYYFHEPAMIKLRSGRLVCHMRNCSQTGHLWQVASDDGGETWSAPEMTPMWGWPADLIQLDDDRVLSVYGHRKEPYGIRACISRDDGNSWDYDDEVIIRDDLIAGGIGYPVSILLDDNRVMTVYWDDQMPTITDPDANNRGTRTSIVASTYQM